jgi:competence protein ComEC
LVIIRGTAGAGDCARSLVLHGDDFATRGAVELYRTPGGWRAVWAQDLRGRRPWTWSYGL